MQERHQEPTLEKIVAYTDGSSFPNPGPGGWATVIVVSEEEQVTLSKGYRLTTNNRMEMMAFIGLLKEFGPGRTFDVYIDSEYVMNGSKMWMHSWYRKGWKRFDFNTGAEKPIQNLDLWKELYPLYKENKVTFFKVKSHTGVKFNEMADVAAGEARKAAADFPASAEIDKGYEETVKK